MSSRSTVGLMFFHTEPVANSALPRIVRITDAGGAELSLQRVDHPIMPAEFECIVIPGKFRVWGDHIVDGLHAVISKRTGSWCEMETVEGNGLGIGSFVDEHTYRLDPEP